MIPIRKTMNSSADTIAASRTAIPRTSRMPTAISTTGSPYAMPFDSHSGVAS